jgi:hypothetical protein
MKSGRLGWFNSKRLRRASVTARLDDVARAWFSFPADAVLDHRGTRASGDPVRGKPRLRIRFTDPQHQAR